ncbi:MAG: hypothetical protein ABIP74_03920 [Candidatus Saccharimonas sp.]
MKSLSFSQLSRMISHFLHRFHVILFVVFVVGGLSLVTLFLGQTITKQDDGVAGTIEQPFDASTMSRIENLRTTSDQSNLNPPSGRTNPFK